MGHFSAPVMDLDGTGTLHLVFGRGGWFLFYLRLADFAARFDKEADFTATLPQPIWSGTRYVSYSVLGWGTRALVALEKVEHVLSRVGGGRSGAASIASGVFRK